jgi:hypothetical protein
MARDDVLTLSPKQHQLLGHALALAHALHSQMGGNGLGVAPGELPPMYDDVDIFVQPGAHGGRGFFSTLGDAVSKGAKELQKSSAVRGLEKKAVSYGAKALRGAAEGALDGVADSVATAVGAPEASPFVDKLIDRGLSSLQKRGEAAIDERIDASGRGHCAGMCGGSMRLAGHVTEPRGAGMRHSDVSYLGGMGHSITGPPHAGFGMRLAE